MFTFDTLDDALAVVHRYQLENFDWGAGSAAGFADSLYVQGFVDLDLDGLAQAINDYIAAVAQADNDGVSHDEALSARRENLTECLHEAAQTRKKLIRRIRSVKLSSDGGAVWEMIAKLSTSTNPMEPLATWKKSGELLSRIAACLRDLREFSINYHESTHMDYVPGRSPVLDRLLLVDIQRFDVTLDKAPSWPGRAPETYLELAALLRLATDDNLSAALEATAPKLSQSS